MKTSHQSSITILTTIKNAEVFENNPYVDEIVICKYQHKLFTVTLPELRKKRYDVVIDTHESINRRSAIILGMLNTNFKVGFLNGIESLLTHRLSILNPNKTHVVDRYLCLAKVFEIYIDKSNLNLLYITLIKSQRTIEDYVIKHDLQHKLTAVINISNNFKLGFWGIDNYNRLLKYLRNYDINIIITSSIEDIETAERIADNKHLIFYNTDFDIYAELIKNVNFVFSPDSFTIQLASAYKIPVFCLFVQHKTAEMINVPYNSDFDFALTEQSDFRTISYGKVLNTFVPYFEYIYQRFKDNSL
jgi:ADP-heptose:LPS heptosyltransferase